MPTPFFANTFPFIPMESHQKQSLTGGIVAIRNLSGLHARPAAAIAARAKQFQCDIRLLRGPDAVNAKSVVAIMGLGTQLADQVQIEARGSDAQQAVDALSELLLAGCGENLDESPVVSVVAPKSATLAPTSPNDFAGVSASPGLAIGTIVQFRSAKIEVTETGGTPALERLKFDAAIQESRAQIAALTPSSVNSAQSKILDAHLELLDDPDLLNLALENIAQRFSAAYSWQIAFTQYAGRLEGLSGTHNAVLRERGSDIRDIGRRVLAQLTNTSLANFELPEGAIVVAEGLTPSDTASFDRSRLLGFCTSTGGASSHVAILARSFGIPAICGIDSAALALNNGTVAVIDGSLGVLFGKPTDAKIVHSRTKIQRTVTQETQAKHQAGTPAVTRDGHLIEVVANVRNVEETQEGICNGADGVGLLRSEFLFDNRSTAPSEDEQAAAYTAVAQALGAERTLVVRTLDIGGDKPLSYLPLPREENPFLGMRGIRVSLAQPDMFRTQLRAILRSAEHTKMHIMFPMIATLEELREAKAILSEEQSLLGATDIQVGLMIEIPSAALMAEQFAKEADFFSIGTNDLTQYTLAMDRGHPQLAKKANGLHPSVLKMIALTCEGARAHGKWVGVCGGLASDLLAVPVLIGLGVTELSASIPAIPLIKVLIKRLTLNECKALASEVTQMGTATEVHERLTTFAKTKQE